MSSNKNFFSELAWLGTSLTVVLALISIVLATFAFYIGIFLGDRIPTFLWVALGLTSLLLGLVVAIQLTYANNWAGKPIVLKPKNAQRPTIGLIFIQGEGIPIDLYRPVASAIQEATADFTVWVGIPQFIGDSPIPRETGLAVKQALRAMKDAGMPDTENLFFVAHSVGGIALQKYLNSFPHIAKGQILLGSFLGKWYLSKLDNEGHTIVNYPVSTLTIGGTLDGLARITRIATAFWYQQINSSKPTDKDNFPVVAIDRATHMQFASGEATRKETPFVFDFDLKPQIEEVEVHKQVGELAYHFIRTKMPDISSENSFLFLEERKKQAQELFQPIWDSLHLEGYNGFKPACYNRAQVNERDNPKCTPYSPWVQESANEIMAGENLSPVPFNLCVKDSFHRSYSILPVHIPKICKQDEKMSKGCQKICEGCEGTGPNTLCITSVTQALYGLLDAFDTGFFPIAAFSLRAKLNSRQNLWKHAGVPNPNYQETDGSPRGSEINQQVYLWALENAGENAKSYFQEVGTPIGMGDDVVPIVAAGPLWLWNYPKYSYLYLDAQQYYLVRSTVMKTSINYPVPSARGFHYCQLLSPAAAIEWIYVDGLRLKASCSGNTFVYGPLGGIDKILKFILRGILRQTRTRGLVKRFVSI